MPKLDLTSARRIKVASGEVLRLKGQGFAWERPWSPLLLPSIYAAYDPRDPSTLFQDTARTVPVTSHNDPVGCISDITGNGHHLFQATAPARGLWQSTGGIAMDGTDDYYREANGTTITIPFYIAAAWFKDAASLGRIIFGLRRTSSNTDFHTLMARDSSGSFLDRGNAQLRSAATSIVNASSAASAWPQGQAAVIDSLAVPGTVDMQINNTTPVSVANIWAAGGQLIDAKIEIANGAFGNPTDKGIFHGGIVALADPGAMRADAKAWLAAHAGVAL